MALRPSFAAARSTPPSPCPSPASASASASSSSPRTACTRFAVPISRAGRRGRCFGAKDHARLQTSNGAGIAPLNSSLARRFPSEIPARSARSVLVLAMEYDEPVRFLNVEKDEEPELTTQMEFKNESSFAENLQKGLQNVDAFLPFAVVASSALALLFPSTFAAVAGRYYALGCLMFATGISLSAKAFLHATEKLPEREIEHKAEPKEDDEAEILIECRNVYKSFGEKHILRGASFQIREGEAVGIIGPSGTGKSTVLRIMAGLLAPDKGEVYVCGQKRQGLISDEALSCLRIGLVFQSAALFDSLTVRENVGFMLYEHSDLSKEKIAELVADSLGAVGLKGVEERLPAELSGGMKKRVALARAIISDDRLEESERELVMYDEPTAGLDPIASTVVEDLIRSVHVKGKDARGRPGKISSYVVVTHQHSTIRRAVDRVLFLHEGKIVWQGPPSEFETTVNPIVRQFAEGSLKGPIRY